MSTPVRTVRTLAGAAAVTLATLAACSSTPGNPSASTTPTAAPTTAPTSAAPTTAAPTAAPTSAPSGGGSGGVPNCGSGELKGSTGPEEGAAGSVVLPLILTNAGSRTCELRGFPGVSYVAGDDGHQVGPAAVMNGERGGEVVLRPGARAVAQLQLVNVADFDAGACRPTPVRGLRVYPPGDTTSLFVERAGTGCAGTPPGNQMSVQTLKPA